MKMLGRLPKSWEAFVTLRNSSQLLGSLCNSPEVFPTLPKDFPTLPIPHINPL